MKDEAILDERLAALRRRIGQDIVGDWLVVSQSMIDKFAEATGDDQYIHVDPEAAAKTPFGGTIAHGFLILSLLPLLAATAPGALPTEGAQMGVNYGGNRVRFILPVRAGARVRGRFRIVDVVRKSADTYRQIMEYAVEVEGQSKPAMVAEWIVEARF